MDSISSASQLQVIVGDELMARICEGMAGQRIYIPQTPPDMVRDHRIYLEFNAVLHDAPSVGSAYVQVAQMEDVSPRTIQRVICGIN